MYMGSRRYWYNRLGILSAPWCLILFLLGGCVNSSMFFLKYDVPLVKVERPQDVKDKYGGFDSILVSDSNKYVFEDSLITAALYYSADGISFIIINKSDHTMKLIWDDAGLIEIDRSLTRVMHNGVKYSERSNSMPSSIIPKNGKIEDVATPINRVYYREGYYGQYTSSPGGWDIRGIFPFDTTIIKQDLSIPTEEDAKPFLNRNKKLIGSKIGLLLPLEIEGIKNEYTFWFEVKDVNIYNPKQ